MGWDGMDGIYLRQLGTLEHLAVLKMDAFWRQCKNLNLHDGHFFRKVTGTLKLYEVSKAVDALNSDFEKCKFMI